MEKGKGLFKHSFFTVSERFLRLFLNLGSFVIIARSLSLSSFGNYSLLFTIFQIFNIISIFGMDVFFISKLPEVQGDSKSLLKNCFQVSLFAAAVAFILFNLSVWFFLGFYHISFLLLGLSFFFNPFLLFNYQNQYHLNAQKNLRYFIYVNILTFLVRISVLSLHNIYLFIIILAAENIGYAILIYIKSRKEAISLPTLLQINNTRLKHIIHSCTPIVLTGFVIIAFSRMDQMFLKWFHYDLEIGYIAVSTRLLEALFFFPAALSMAFYPNLASQYKNKNKFTESISELSFYFLLYGVVCIGLYFLVGKYIIAVFFGQKYLLATKYLDIQIFVLLFNGMGMNFSRICNIENKNGLQLQVNIFALIINIVLSIVLVNILGAKGVAYSLLITQFFSSFVLWYFFPSTRPYFKDILGQMPYNARKFFQKLYLVTFNNRINN